MDVGGTGQVKKDSHLHRTHAASTHKDRRCRSAVDANAGSCLLLIDASVNEYLF